MGQVSDLPAGTPPEPASPDFLRWLHREFYRDAPEPILRVAGAQDAFLMAAGEWRSRPEQDVAVGRHMPPSSRHVEEFMRYFADRYRLDPMGKAGCVIAMAAAHHRFNYIHPFPDGNGRVSRLMSHAVAWKAGIAAHGLWSISRGLARGLAGRSEYKQMMDRADTPPESELDGRGNLSQRALIEFITWFLRAALDQVAFMSTLFDLDHLRTRLHAVVAERDSLKPEAARLLEDTLRRCEIERGEAPRNHGSPRALRPPRLERLTKRGTPRLGHAERPGLPPLPRSQFRNAVPSPLSAHLNARRLPMALPPVPIEE